MLRSSNIVCGLLPMLRRRSMLKSPSAGGIPLGVGKPMRSSSFGSTTAGRPRLRACLLSASSATSLSRFRALRASWRTTATNSCGPQRCGGPVSRSDGCHGSAESPVVRLRQMKGLVQRFSATLTGWKSSESQPRRIALLPQQLYRYDIKAAKATHPGASRWRRVCLCPRDRSRSALAPGSGRGGRSPAWLAIRICPGHFWRPGSEARRQARLESRAIVRRQIEHESADRVAEGHPGVTAALEPPCSASRSATCG